jgi:hypothetical protein
MKHDSAGLDIFPEIGDEASMRCASSSTVKRIANQDVTWVA